MVLGSIFNENGQLFEGMRCDGGSLDLCTPSKRNRVFEDPGELK